MNRKQWFALTIGFYLIGFWMSLISSQWKLLCSLDSVTMVNIVSCIRGHIFAPYPYIFFVLGLAFLICGFLED